MLPSLLLAGKGFHTVRLDPCSPIPQRTSELGVGDAGPFSATVTNTRAPHHVAQIMLLVPLVPNAIHDPFVGSADLLVGCVEKDQEILAK